MNDALKFTVGERVTITTFGNGRMLTVVSGVVTRLAPQGVYIGWILVPLDLIKVVTRRHDMEPLTA